nr:MAG TPA: hypothetical protein [Crassvirales sp.]
MHYLQLIFMIVLPNLFELRELMMPAIISRIDELASALEVLQRLILTA